MRHLAAYLLLVVGGNAAPSAEDVKSVLGQAGIETDSERLSTLIAELAGKDVNELVALGKEKLMVGGAMAAAPAGGGGAAPAAGGAPAAAAKEEKPKEEEVDALDGGMDMFGGGGKGGGGDY
jgi:large subunit ribosomal protein LP2